VGFNSTGKNWLVGFEVFIREPLLYYFDSHPCVFDHATRLLGGSESHLLSLLVYNSFFCPCGSFFVFGPWSATKVNAG
jgi:hypothetical protein